MDFSELPRSIAMGVGALAGLYFKDMIPGPDILDAPIGAILGAKAYDFSQGDTSIMIPMDMGTLLGASAAALASVYPIGGFSAEMVVPAAAGLGDFLGNSFA
jgi:hypothetical protein